jgi:hypothetical protein
MSREKTYYFDVRETTVRSAQVNASSVAEARQKLDAWLASKGASNDDDSIVLGDLDSVRITFRSVRDVNVYPLIPDVDWREEVIAEHMGERK